MDRMIYVNMGSAKAMMNRQEVLANNLANASTTGFRAEMQATRAVPVRGDGASTRVYALDTVTGYDPTPGPLSYTGRSLDVAMQGNAWLAVQALDGTEAYTRMGSLQVSAEGVLSTSGGLTVIGDGGPVTLPPNAEPSIAADGTISVRQATGTVTTVGRLKLVTPEEALNRGDDGLFRAGAGDLPADPNARIQEGALEGSNVNPIECMVAMISAARQFESHMKLLQAADKDDQSASRLLSMSS